MTDDITTRVAAFVDQTGLKLAPWQRDLLEVILAHPQEVYLWPPQ
jgi:spore cortex formation protein SpoVR/YcgB (stage V sporulation)